MGLQTGKKITLSVWETNVSRHNGGPISSPLKPPQHDRSLMVRGVLERGGPQLAMPEDDRMVIRQIAVIVTHFVGRGRRVRLGTAVWALDIWAPGLSGARTWLTEPNQYQETTPKCSRRPIGSDQTAAPKWTSPNGEALWPLWGPTSQGTSPPNSTLRQFPFYLLFYSLLLYFLSSFTFLGSPNRIFPLFLPGFLVIFIFLSKRTTWGR